MADYGIDAEELRELYHSEYYTLQEVADHFDVSYGAIYRRFEKHGIERRDTPMKKERRLLERNQKKLLELYDEEGYTITMLSDKTGVSRVTVNKFLQDKGRSGHRGHSKHSNWTYSELFDEDFLKEQHHENSKTLSKISEEIGCSRPAVAAAMDRLGIDIDSSPHELDVEDYDQRYYGKNWPKQRSLARERDSYQCQGCGMGENEHIQKRGQELHVHHILPRHVFISDGVVDTEKANELENLVTFCAHCHKKWEGVPVAPEAINA